MADVRDLEPTQLAALAATTRALASSGTRTTGAGQFQEALFRGSHGYLAVYAAGENAIVGIIGTAELNVGMLRYCLRDVSQRIAAYATGFGGWAGPAQADSPTSRADDRPGTRPGSPRGLPTRPREN